MHRIRSQCAARADWLLETTMRLARLESPSDDLPAVHRCGDALAGLLTDAGGRVERPDRDGRRHVLATFGTGPAHVLLLGHVDTVWPVGSIAAMPVAMRDGKLFGPGTFDMKAGVAIALLATSLVRARLSRLRVRLLFTSDEEVGSGSSRALIEEEALRSEAVLVFEPALPGGGLKTSRKGLGTFRLSVQGVSAHAGIAPDDGASAIVELARQVLDLEALQDRAAGTTINTGVCTGGTRSNVVAEAAAAEIDARVASASEQRRVEVALANLRAHDPRTRLTLRGAFERPPLERGPHVERLFALAQRAGDTLGLRVEEGSTGGASDGNFTAALGVPTLDGLGAVGNGAHARHEHVVVDALPDRAALSAAILLMIDADADWRRSTDG